MKKPKIFIFSFAFHLSASLFLFSEYSYATETSNINYVTKTACANADVVARELNVAGIRWMGHVGIIMVENDSAKNSECKRHVLEVMDDQPVVQINSFEQFSHFPDAPFWGMRHGLRNYPELTKEDAKAIIEHGKRQKLYGVEYTLTHLWREGGPCKFNVFDNASQQWQEVNDVCPGFFRCDTFVNYTYKKGAHINLPDSIFLTPKATFYSFINEREIENLMTQTPAQQMLALANTESNQVRSLEEIFQEPILNIEQADQSIEKFLNASSPTRSQKLLSLWQLAQNYHAQPMKFKYLVDVIAFLKPTELTSDIIASYRKESSLANKKNLLIALGETALNTKKEAQVPLASHQPRSMMQYNSASQQLLNEIINTENDPKLLGKALKLFPRFASPEQTYLMLDTLSAKNNLSAMDVKAHNVPNNEIISLKIRVALSTNKMQRSLLNLINEYKKKDKETEKYFACQLSAAIATTPLNSIEQELLAPLTQFIQDNAQGTNTETNSSKAPSCEWQAALNNLNAH